MRRVWQLFRMGQWRFPMVTFTLFDNNNNYKQDYYYYYYNWNEIQVFCISPSGIVLEPYGISQGSLLHSKGPRILSQKLSWHNLANSLYYMFTLSNSLQITKKIWNHNKLCVTNSNLKILINKFELTWIFKYIYAI